jgi:DNA-binding IclR family transcriptional regulator
MSGDLPGDVRAFLLAHISSVTQVEALLLMRRIAEPWTPARLARELRIEPAGAFEQLELLVSQRLVERVAPDAYRYAPGEAFDAVVGRLAAIYDDRRVTIIQLIYSRPLGPIRVFADAFRLRRDDKEE